jgi:2-methylcitrate dehydratase PrpD
MAGAQGVHAGLAARLLERTCFSGYAGLPPDVQRVAQDCLTDWLACTLAGLSEPAAVIVSASALEEGAHAQASFVGRGVRGSVSQAALVNGTASHALDFDDVNLAVPGHLSVVILPAVLALAEHRAATGAQTLAAFVAGYEFACRVGRLVEPAHYANGHHATATIGCLGAAVASSWMLGLDPDQTCHAVGLAATQAAGMKSMFGTMAKPLHAGLASRAGLQAAQLAARGFTSRMDALECREGFAALRGQDLRVDDALADPPGGFHLLGNLFKFHAACYSTHATIEAVTALRLEHGLRPQDVDSIRVMAGLGCSICNIAEPQTDLEAKFSLRATAAFALLGLDTSGLQAWGRAVDPDVVAVRDRVWVELVPERSLSDAEVRMRLHDGTELRRFHDCGIPLADKLAQSRRVREKFLALSAPVVGPERAQALADRLAKVGALDSVAPLLQLGDDVRQVAAHAPARPPH